MKARLPFGSNGFRILIVSYVIHAWNLLDIQACELPRALHYPGQGTIETSSLVFDLLEHGLGEVQTLFSLIATSLVGSVFGHAKNLASQNWSA
jgi:hypothetical protein